MLSPELQLLWVDYVGSERVRVRSESLVKLSAFIEKAQIQDIDAISSWALHFIDASVSGRDSTPIRMPLFRSVLFPVLLAGYRRNDPECIWQLSRLCQLLYKNPACSTELDPSDQTEYGLLLKLHRLCPKRLDSRKRLISVLANRFEYALHELPIGVLYAQDGATPQQCDELMDELHFFESLVTEADHGELRQLIKRAAFFIHHYRSYLLDEGPKRGFEEYLSRHGLE